MRKLTHQEIVARQVSQTQQNKLPLVVVLDNIRSLQNVGSMFRTADGLGVEKMYLCGITGYPPQSGITKTSLGAEESVEWEYCQNSVDVIKKLKKKKYRIVCLEQTQGAIDYQEYIPSIPTCLVVGNEIDGVSEQALSFCDDGVEILMQGVKNSLNVSVAFGIVAYHIRQSLLSKC